MVQVRGLTICIPTHRGRGRYVSALLTSLAAPRRTLSVPVEIIVVDDSPDEEFHALDRHCAELAVRHLRGPRPAGAKRNLAAREARFDLLLFIDSDCLATADLLTAHVDALRAAAPDVAGVVGATVALDDGPRPWQPIDFSRWCRADADPPKGPVVWGPTSNLSILRAVFLRLGGFDEDIFTPVGGEDVDLGARLCDHGYRWTASPRAVVLHRRDATGRLPQILNKQFMYGRADVFLTARHRARRRWRANPFVLGVLAGLACLPFTGPAPLIGILVLLGPPLAYLAVDLARRDLGRAADPARRDGFPPRTGGWLAHLARHVSGVLVDLSFDAGVAWEALRRGRPLLALRRFPY
ncbi:glycosyltransferase family 2 protein [Plantactinospora sonchi]|uniref:Glycosyltransferase n=1 Tax=Plantactinospora sonchi TaxID=1544735 RepID=A0ABU7RTL5_9ACTN